MKVRPVRMSDEDWESLKTIGVETMRQWVRKEAKRQSRKKEQS